MDPHGPTAQRFPLVARFRPACLPLPDRVRALADLAGTASQKADQGLASAVYNQAALIASDIGAPGLARRLCHQHAAAYLHACPLPATAAIRALEPVVNLARLQIRAGRADDGRARLLALYEAVSQGTAAQFDDVTVPADITVATDDRNEVRAWLWRILLADGTRTLTTRGRWREALVHIDAHCGVGKRMLDGRQVAVLAALAADDTEDASALLRDTMPGEEWEQAVTECLTALCRRDAEQLTAPDVTALANGYLQRKPEHGMTVFDTRLGLTTLDIIEHSDASTARQVVDELHRRTMNAGDGYAARESLAHPLFTALATDRQQQDCMALVHVCAFGVKSIPRELRGRLTAALRTSDRTIRESVARP